MDPAPPVIYPLSLHHALPIFGRIAHTAKPEVWQHSLPELWPGSQEIFRERGLTAGAGHPLVFKDRKSTRLNSSHLVISYAVFCLKKKKTTHTKNHTNTPR